MAPATSAAAKWTVSERVAIEVKASARWDKRFNRGLHRVRDDLGRGRTACYGVYLGQRAALWDDVRVLPLVEFLERLWAGEIIGAAPHFS